MIKKRKGAGFFQWLFMLSLIFSICVFSTGKGFAGSRFSFLVVGDTRTEPYITGGPNERDGIQTVFKKRFQAPLELFFDENSQQLVRAVHKKGEGHTITLNYRDGWVSSMVEKNNGNNRVIMRDTGRKWVFDRIVATIRKGAAGTPGHARFLLHGGDIPLFGFQGKTLDESPYWQLFEDELLNRLPPAGKDLGLPGRVFVAVGNHATWEDPAISGFTTTLPWLADPGLSRERRIYAFSFQESRFIFLDCGDYSSTGTAWTSQFPPFEVQMEYLTGQLNQAWLSGIKNVFVVYHKPSYVKVGHDPLPPDQSPHRVFREFADRLKICVFNSHTHTTEQYRVDNIDYLVLGGGGAPQKFTLTRHPTTEKELYWKGKERVEEYNYLEVRVDGPNFKALLHRFRPTQPQNPMGVVELLTR